MAVIADDTLHTVLRRRANGESVEQIQPDLIIPTGKRKGQAPSVASIYRRLAEHQKQEAYPEAVGGGARGLHWPPGRRRHPPSPPRPHPAPGRSAHAGRS